MDKRLKRAYELAKESDGYRVLVDRLWLHQPAQLRGGAPEA